MASRFSAVYPGSFDPLTNGHIDLVERSLAIFDHVIVAVLRNTVKATLFSPEERVELIKKELSRFPGVEVRSFSGLLVDFVRECKTRVVVRGLRAVSDYDYEAQMALINKNLNEDIETFFLMAREENSYISSSLVRQVAQLKGDVSKFVPPSIAEALRKKLS
jgi:pantetheine-phosphate adenylyltransferase